MSKLHIEKISEHQYAIKDEAGDIKAFSPVRKFLEGQLRDARREEKEEQKKRKRRRKKKKWGA